MQIYELNRAKERRERRLTLQLCEDPMCQIQGLIKRGFIKSGTKLFDQL